MSLPKHQIIWLCWLFYEQRDEVTGWIGLLRYSFITLLLDGLKSFCKIGKREMGHIEADKSTKEKETKAATTTMVYPVSASNC